jgi:molecular chaperone DnaJ
VAGGSTHYERLGVRPDASAAEIRRAYRAVARLEHPDTAGEGARAGADMAAVNEAWRVLSDPGRRAMYDATMRAASSGSAVGSAVGPTGRAAEASRSERATETDRSFEVPAPAGHFPKWPFVLVFVLAVIFIFTAGAISKDPGPAAPDNLLFAGSCVTVLANRDAVEVGCDAPHDGVVVTLVNFDQVCPSGSDPYRDRQGRGYACLSG